MDALFNVVNLDQKPCVVYYLEGSNRFIIGTYELFSSIEDARSRMPADIFNINIDDECKFAQTLKQLNSRAGKLIILGCNELCEANIEFEYNCLIGGGVFDLKVKFHPHDSSYTIYVAHSNGYVCVYKLDLQAAHKICLIQSTKIGNSQLLTSIDVFSDINITAGSTANSNQTDTNSFNSNSTSEPSSSDSDSSTNHSKFFPYNASNRLVVGDSDGFIALVDRNCAIRQKVTPGDSIWQVKTFRLSSGKDIIFVAAEDSSWYLYGYDHTHQQLQILYKNSKDFDAGVTCISVLNVSRSFEYDSVELLLGSYDETLQTYHVKLNHDGLSKPGVCHKSTVSIENGGIWRVKQSVTDKNNLFIAAMYAGTFTLKLEKGDQIHQDMIQSLIEADSNGLHYDVDMSEDSVCCIADFNNRSCILKVYNDCANEKAVAH